MLGRILVVVYILIAFLAGMKVHSIIEKCDCASVCEKKNQEHAEHANKPVENVNVQAINPDQSGQQTGMVDPNSQNAPQVNSTDAQHSSQAVVNNPQNQSQTQNNTAAVSPVTPSVPSNAPQQQPAQSTQQQSAQTAVNTDQSPQDVEKNQQPSMKNKPVKSVGKKK